MKNFAQIMHDYSNSDINTLLMSIVIIMLIYRFIDRTINGNHNDKN